jgi:hypothetical protein
MKNRLLGYTDIETLYQEHLRQQAKIWSELREQLYQQYLAEGYWEGFALVKANNDILELRSKPNNPSTMIIPKEQTTQGDLD